MGGPLRQINPQSPRYLLVKHFAHPDLVADYEARCCSLDELKAAFRMLAQFYEACIKKLDRTIKERDEALRVIFADIHAGTMNLYQMGDLVESFYRDRYFELNRKYQQLLQQKGGETA